MTSNTHTRRRTERSLTTTHRKPTEKLPRSLSPLTTWLDLVDLRNLQNTLHTYSKVLKPRKSRTKHTHPINLLEDERQHRVGRMRHSMQMRPQSNVLTSQVRSKTSRYADAAAVEHLAPPCSTTASTCALNCSTILHEMLPQINTITLHEMLPPVNATTNATMITDEHHYDPRDVPMLHEARPHMLQAEDERLATKCSTSARTRTLSSRRQYRYGRR